MHLQVGRGSNPAQARLISAAKRERKKIFTALEAAKNPPPVPRKALRFKRG